MRTWWAIGPNENIRGHILIVLLQLGLSRWQKIVDIFFKCWVGGSQKKTVNTTADEFLGAGINKICLSQQREQSTVLIVSTALGQKNLVETRIFHFWLQLGSRLKRACEEYSMSGHTRLLYYTDEGATSYLVSVTFALLPRGFYLVFTFYSEYRAATPNSVAPVVPCYML